MNRYPATRNPMSSARRDHIHGRLVPMTRPEGELSLLAGTLTLVGIGLIGMFAAVAAGV